MSSLYVHRFTPSHISISAARDLTRVCYPCNTPNGSLGEPDEISHWPPRPPSGRHEAVPLIYLVHISTIWAYCVYTLLIHSPVLVYISEWKTRDKQGTVYCKDMNLREGSLFAPVEQRDIRYHWSQPWMAFPIVVWSILSFRGHLPEASEDRLEHK